MYKYSFTVKTNFFAYKSKESFCTKSSEVPIFLIGRGNFRDFSRKFFSLFIPLSWIVDQLRKNEISANQEDNVSLKLKAIELFKKYI